MHISFTRQDGFQAGCPPSRHKLGVSRAVRTVSKLGVPRAKLGVPRAHTAPSFRGASFHIVGYIGDLSRIASRAGCHDRVSFGMLEGITKEVFR